MSPAQKKIVKDVEEFGWHVPQVFQNGKGPDFAYSIGLFKSYGHAEIIIFGLALDVMWRLINSFGAEIKNGKKIRPNERYTEFVDNYALEFREIPNRWYDQYLGQATWFYRGKAFPAVQCFWPDKEHHFPWETRYTNDLKGLQPILFQY